mmetsp:Transcript_10964/g.20432  ORF Transcript_10964/g.20432 Transcript_10964/m.20432 type:complete len:430 (-) Transcript_10964:75-1364(-)
MGQQVACGFECGDRACYAVLDLQYEYRDRSSCCGSDAFYRDLMFEPAEIGVDHSPTAVGKVREQARLKMRKGSVFMDYAKHALVPGIDPGRRPSFSLPAGEFGELERNTSKPADDDGCLVRTLSGWKRDSDWLGKTIPESWEEGLPAPQDGPCWKRGTGDGLPVRCGPNYAKQRGSTKSQGNLYDCLTLDGITPASGTIFDEIIGSVVKAIPPASKGSIWKNGCPLPRIICMHVMLPYYNPKNPWAKEDGGCNFVSFFEIKNSTIDSLSLDNPPAAVRMLRQFFAGPAGEPGGAKDAPNRSLYARRDRSKYKDLDPYLLKVVGWCENEKEMGVPKFLHQFNGKSIPLADSGYAIKDPDGEWLEVGFDLRKFPLLFKDALYTFKHYLPLGQFHLGFMVQAVEDDELPEGIIGDLYLCGISITEHVSAIGD